MKSSTVIVLLMVFCMSCCCSSSAAGGFFVSRGVSEESGPEQGPPPGPPVVVDVPPEFRTSSTPWGLGHGSSRETMKAHNQGHLDGDLWAANTNTVGKWYQMDNGKIAEIVGVAIKGRLSGHSQWVTTFKVKYYVAGVWKDVDGGATFTGNTDSDTLVEVKFASPVTTRYIRIYPQTFNNHMSLRAGLITNSTLKKSSLKLLNIPPTKRVASSWWNNNDDPNWHPNKGVLDSNTGWHPKNGAPDDGSEWYEMQLNNRTKVAGVALQGRGEGNDPASSWHWQWITSFTAKYLDEGQWKDVDDGFKYSGLGDKDSTVWVPFNTPVDTTSIRIYPKTWNGWYSGRFDLLGLN